MVPRALCKGIDAPCSLPGSDATCSLPGTLQTIVLRFYVLLQDQKTRFNKKAGKLNADVHPFRLKSVMTSAERVKAVEESKNKCLMSF